MSTTLDFLTRRCVQDGGWGSIYVCLFEREGRGERDYTNL